MNSCMALGCLLAMAAGTGACGGKSVVTNGSTDGGPGADSGVDAGPGLDTGLPDAADAGQPDTAPPPPPVPMYHRPDDSQCMAPRSAGSCNAGPMGPPFVCTMDSECVDGGADGRCTN